MMKPAQNISRSAVLLLATAGLMAPVLVGCEEQVVRREYGPPPMWTNQDVEYRHVPPKQVSSTPTQPAEEGNVFEEVGEAMFGWMNGDDKAEPEPTPRTPRYEPIWSRHQPAE